MPAAARVPHDEPNEELTTDVEVVRSARVVHVAGEIDLSTVGELESAIERAESEAVGAGVPIVVVDLRGVTFLGADGVRGLVAAHNRIAAEGGSLRIVSPPGGGIIRRLLDLSGVGALLDLFETVDSAVPPDRP